MAHLPSFRWRVLALVTGAALVAGRSAAQPAARFGHLGAADGLSQGTVWALHQDRTGFLWVGTQDGLNRYDGHGFTVFRYDPADPASIAANHVWALAEDASGALWVGTNGGGLSRFDARTGRFQHWRHDPADPASLCGNEVLSLASGRGGALWVGTTAGVCRLDTRTGKVWRGAGTALDSLRATSAIGLLEDPAGRLWVAAGSDGLARYTPRTGRLDRFPHDPSDPATPAPGRAQVLLGGADGTVWIGHEGGLTRYDARSGRFLRSLSGPGAASVRALAQDATGVLWVGTYGEGLVRLDPTARAPMRYTPGAGPRSLAGSDVGALHVDRAGVVWVGLSLGAGLAWLPPRTGAFGHLQPSSDVPYAPIVRSAAESQGALWLATGAGLARAGPAGIYTTLQGPGCVREPLMRAAVRDHRGRLWTGSNGGGLCVHRVGTGAARSLVHDPADPASLASDVVNALAVDTRGQVWVGTDQGLDRYSEAAGAFVHVRLNRATPEAADALVGALLAARDGAVWVGTDGAGLHRVAPDGQVRSWLHRAGDPGTLSGDAIHALYEDDRGTVWLGTDAGVDRVDPSTGAVRRYGGQGGVPLGAVLALAGDDDGQLWMATTGGLVRFDPVRGGATRFDARGPLPFNEFVRGHALRTRQGRLVFGGREGAVVVNPSALDRSPYAAPVVITALEVAGTRVHRPLWYGARATLGPGHRAFTLLYAALDLTGAHHVRYRYRLEGLDAAWTVAGERRVASYANVPPGRYRFTVQATDAAGRWARHARVILAVQPWWWETVAFRLFVAVALVTLGSALHRWRVHTLLQVERARRRIADDLHDDLGGRLGALALRVELAGLDEPLAPHAQARLAEAAAAVRSASADLRDTIWVVDAGHDSLGALVERMEAVAYEALSSVPHRVLQHARPPEARVAPEVRRGVLMAFREALHNAARHGSPPVEVRLHANAASVGFEVRDEGDGFDPACMGLGAAGAVGGRHLSPPGSGRGLRSMHERAARLGGSLHIDAVPGRGTSVRLDVPLQPPQARRTV